MEWKKELKWPEEDSWTGPQQWDLGVLDVRDMTNGKKCKAKGLEYVRYYHHLSSTKVPWIINFSAMKMLANKQIS